MAGSPGGTHPGHPYVQDTRNVADGTCTRVRALTDQYDVVPNSAPLVKLLDEPSHSRNPLRFSDRSRMERPNHSAKFRQVISVEGAEHRLESVEVVGIRVFPADGVDKAQGIHVSRADGRGKTECIQETVER